MDISKILRMRSFPGMFLCATVCRIFPANCHVLLVCRNRNKSTNQLFCQKKYMKKEVCYIVGKRRTRSFQKASFYFVKLTVTCQHDPLCVKLYAHLLKWSGLLGLPGLLIELRLHIAQKVLGIWKYFFPRLLAMRSFKWATQSTCMTKLALYDLLCLFGLS